jgi:orotate phosphoribosyltransferase
VTREELGIALMKACVIRGEFRLRSGAVSSEYFDKYRFESDPELLAAVAKELVRLLPHDTQAVAGLELGGVPIATAISIQGLVHLQRAALYPLQRRIGIVAFWLRNRSRKRSSSEMV